MLNENKTVKDLNNAVNELLRREPLVVDPKLTAGTYSPSFQMEKDTRRNQAERKAARAGVPIFFG